MNTTITKEYAQQGFASFEQGDYLNAILAFTKVLNMRTSNQDGDPEIPFDRIYLYRAFAWAKRGEYEIATMDINDALRESPCNAALYSARGQLRRDLAQFGKAIRDFTLAVEFDPQPDYYYERSVTHLKESRYTEAFSDIETAIGLTGHYGAIDHPEFFVTQAEIYLMNEEYEKALQTCSLIQETDAPPAEVYRIMADVYLATGNHIKAHEMFTEAVKRNPELTELDLSLAKTHYAKQEFTRTIFYCTRYLEAYPSSYEAYQLRGDSHYHLEELDEARNDCFRAIEYNPNCVEACRTLERIYLKRHDYRSVDHWKKRIEEIENKMKNNHYHQKGSKHE